MYYEINVALNGKHYFATSERSLITENEAKQLYSHFTKLFPAKDGYSLSLRRYENHIYTIADSEEV